MKSCTIAALYICLILVAVSPAAFAQSGWQSQDIGATAPGSTSISNGVFTIRGNGDDIWGPADGCRFAYLLGDDNIEIVARITSQEITNQWAKAGVMIRQSTAAGSVHAFMSRTPANGMAFQWRPTADSTSSNNNGGPNALPRWVRLRKVGNQFSGYYAQDVGGRPGTWTQQGPTVQVNMTNPVLVGLAVTSHQAGVLCEAVFDNVQTTGTRKTGAGILIGRLAPPERPAAVQSPLARLRAGLFGSIFVNADHQAAILFGRKPGAYLRTRFR